MSKIGKLREGIHLNCNKNLQHKFCCIKKCKSYDVRTTYTRVVQNSIIVLFGNFNDPSKPLRSPPYS